MNINLSYQLRIRLYLVALAQLLDLSTFLMMVDRWGIVAEANPLVKSAFEIGGLNMIILLKILLIILVVSTLIDISKKETWGNSALFLIGVFVPTYGALTNLNLITWGLI